MSICIIFYKISSYIFILSDEQEANSRNRLSKTLILTNTIFVSGVKGRQGISDKATKNLMFWHVQYLTQTKSSSLYEQNYIAIKLCGPKRDMANINN